MLAHPSQIVSGVALLALGGAVGAAAETAPRAPPTDLAAWSQALQQSADAPLLTAAGASALLGLALLVAPALSVGRRRRAPVAKPVAPGGVEPFDVEAAIRRVIERLAERIPPDAPVGFADELSRRLTSLFCAVETEKWAAAILLDAGDERAAASRLEALARRQDEVFGPRSRLAGRTWRELAVLRLAENPVQALEAYRRAGRRDPNDYWGQLFCARLASVAGDGTMAQRAAQDAVRTASCERTRIGALTLFGDVTRIAGDLVQARGAYESALAIGRQLAARDHHGAQWLCDLSSAYQRLGDVEDAAGSPARALARYRQSLPLALALVEREPANLHWRLGLEVARRRIAELQTQIAERAG